MQMMMMWQLSMIQCVLFLLSALIVHGFSPMQSRSIRAKFSIRRNPTQILRRPRQANLIPSLITLRVSPEDSSSSSSPTPPKPLTPSNSAGANVDPIQQAEQAREQLRLQMKEAETRRTQLEKDIKNNAKNVEVGKQNLQSNLKQNEKDLQELKELQKVATKKFNFGNNNNNNNNQFPTLETIAKSVQQVPTTAWAGTAVGASVGGLALGRINLQKRKKLKEEQEYEQRLAEAETARNEKIAKANSNRDRFLFAGSSLLVGTAVAGLAQFSQQQQKDSTTAVNNNNNKKVEQSVARNNKNQKPGASSSSTTLLSTKNGPTADLPYLDQRIQKAEDKVKGDQQNLKDTAEQRKALQLQMAQEEKTKRELTQRLEETEQSIRQANLAKERFEMESQLNTRKAAVDLMSMENPQSSPSDKVVAQQQAKKEVQMAEAQRLAAFAETQRISEMERKLDEEVKARMALLQKLQSTEASLKQANDRAQLAALEAQMAKVTKDQALADAKVSRDKIIAETIASKDKALAEAKATTEKALAEKQRLEQQAAAEKQKAQLAAMESQKIAESNERAMAQVLASELMAAEAKAEAEEKTRIAMQLQQEKSKQQQQGAATISPALISSVQAAVNSKTTDSFIDTKGISDKLQQGADVFQVKRDQTALVTRAAVDELVASTKYNVELFGKSPIARSLAASVGDENLPAAAAAIAGTGVVATGFVATAMKNAKKNNDSEPNAAAETTAGSPSSPFPSYTPPGTNTETTASKPASTNPFQSYNPSETVEPRKNSFFTSKDPRTDMTKPTNFFTKTDSFQKTPPGFLSAFGRKKSTKGEGQKKKSSAGTDSSKGGGFSSKGFGFSNGGATAGGVVPISTTASAPTSTAIQAPKGSPTPSFGTSKGSSMTPAGSFKGSKYGLANGSLAAKGSNGFGAPNLGLSKAPPGSKSPKALASTAFGKPNNEMTSSNFGAPTSTKGTNNSFGAANVSTSPTAKPSGFASSKLGGTAAGLGSNSFGSTTPKGATSFGAANGSTSPTSKRSMLANGSTGSTTSPAPILESKGQNNVAGFGERNGISAGTVNTSQKGSKGFSPYGRTETPKSGASSTKGSTQSSFNPSNSPFGNANTGSSASVGSSSTTAASSPKGYGTNNATPGATQSNPSNSPFGNSNGAASAVSKGVSQSNLGSAKGSNQSSFNPSNSLLGNTNAASSAGTGSSGTMAKSSINTNGYNPTSGATQSSQSFDPSNYPYGDSKGVAAAGYGSSRTVQTATSPSAGYNPTNPSSGATQSSQASFNPSNSPFGSSKGAAATAGATTGNSGSGISTGYNPSNPGSTTAQSSSPQTASSVQPGMTSNFGSNQGATNTSARSATMGGLNQSPANVGPNSPSSIAQPSSSNPVTQSSDTAADEQRWRESKPNQGDWWNVEKRDYFTTVGRRESRSFTGGNPTAGTTTPVASSYSPFESPNQASRTQSSMQSYSPPNQGKSMDTNQEEQFWRQSSSPSGHWFDTERLDYYTDRGVRLTRSFAGNGVSASSLSSYSPFGNQNSQTTSQQASIPPASSASSAITPLGGNTNNDFSNQGRTSPSLDSSEVEKQWRESSSGAPGGQWFEQEKLDFYTSRGTRATRSFNGGGTTTDVAPNNNNINGTGR